MRILSPELASIAYTVPGITVPGITVPGITQFLQTDERGSVIAVTNSSGALVAANSYDEFGIPASGNAGRFEYTGQTWFPEVGLYNYKARWYSPTLGRFMQTDPIGYGDGLNWYNYAHGDPVNGSDPTGLVACPPGSPWDACADGHQCPSGYTYSQGYGCMQPYSGNPYQQPFPYTPTANPTPVWGGGGGSKPTPQSKSWLDQINACWSKLDPDAKAALIADGVGTAAAFGGLLGETIANTAAAAGATTGLFAVLLNGATSDNKGQASALPGTTFTIGSAFTPAGATNAGKLFAKSIPFIGIAVAAGLTAYDAYNAAKDAGCFKNGG